MHKLVSILSALVFLTIIAVIPNSSFAQMPHLDIEFGNPQITDVEGRPIQTINAGDRIFFSMDIKNNLNEKIDFVYVLTLDNLQSSSWVSGSLEPGQQFSPAIGYTVTYGGTHNVGLYLVKPLQQILKPDDPGDYSVFAIGKNQLSAPLFLKINVVHPFPPQEFKVNDDKIKYNLEFVTASEISNVSIDKNTKKVSFTVSGPTGTFGSLILKVPVFLFDDAYKVTKNGQPYTNWSVERVGAFNYITINYSHSTNDYELHFNQRNEPLSTNSGYVISYNWLPFPVTDRAEPHVLKVSVVDSEHPDEPKTSKFNVKIAKLGSARFNENGVTGDDATGNLRIGQNILYKDPNENSDKLDMEITLLEYDNTLIGERATPNPSITIIPEYPLGVLIVLFMAVTFVIVSTRFRTLKQIHF